jgi:hypothetical protein
MSCGRAGAIIRIIFYILRLKGKTNDYFDANYIFDQYNKILKSPSHGKTIKSFIKKFKKHGNKKRILTLEKRGKLRNWLYKHTKIKRIFWFEYSKNRFRLKKEYIKCLKDLMKT